MLYYNRIISDVRTLFNSCGNFSNIISYLKTGNEIKTECILKPKNACFSYYVAVISEKEYNRAVKSYGKLKSYCYRNIQGLEAVTCSRTYIYVRDPEKNKFYFIDPLVNY